MTFVDRTPWPHQAEALARFTDADYYALFFEQRCGKSWVEVRVAAELYRAGKIDALVVIAPNGVHEAWNRDHVPENLPSDVPREALTWRSAATGTVKFKRRLREVVATEGLAVITLNVDALRTDRAFKFLKWLIERRKVKLVVDESTDVKTPGARRTKRLLALARGTVQRSILDGTPVTTSPFNLYAPCRFLATEALGFTSYYAFKQRYGVFEKQFNGQQGRFYDALVEYRRLDELKAKLDRFSTRVTRRDVRDVPSKVYEKVYVELTREQRRVYDALRDELIVELRSGAVVAVPMVLQRLTRLQQAACGYLPGNEDGDLEPVDPERNPRLDRFVETVARLDGKVVVWGRFIRDLELVHAALVAAGHTAVRYDGTVPAAERDEHLARFREDPDLRFFVANPRVGGRGLPLHVADAAVYYSTPFGLYARLQSEDRVEHLEKTTPNLILDLVAMDTVDEMIVAALRAGKEVADVILGDEPTRWL